MIKIFIVHLILLSIFIEPTTSYSEESEILSRLSRFESKFDDKIDYLLESVNNISSRTTSLEVHKDQQAMMLDRFYKINWVSTETKMDKLEDDISSIKTQLAQLDGMFKIFSFIAFMLNLMVPMFVTWFFHRRLEVRKGDI